MAIPAFAQPAQPATQPFTVGTCTHFSQRKGLPDENLRLIRAAGVTSIRDEVVWAAVERDRGVRAVPERVDRYVDAATRHGLETMLILGYGNRHYDDGRKPTSADGLRGYTDYCAFVVDHFKGRVRRYEVWNEYNIAIGGPRPENGDPTNYVAMLKEAVPAIRAADPDATIIGGVVAPLALRDGYFEKINELGLAGLCDAISVHTYNYGRGPGGRTPEAWLKIMQDVDATVRKHNGGRPMPLLCTEHGWPTFVAPPGGRFANAVTSPQRSADYLARMYLLARTMPNLGGVWFYDFQDDGWNPAEIEDNFGVVRPDLTPKPAYFALADVAPIAGEATFERRIDVGDDRVWLLTFKHPTLGRMLAAWSVDDAAATQVVLRPTTSQPADARVSLRRVGRPAIERGWSHREWAGAPDAAVEANALSLVADGTPTLVTLGDVEVNVDRVTSRSRPTTRPATAPSTSPDAAAPDMAPPQPRP